MGKKKASKKKGSSARLNKVASEFELQDIFLTHAICRQQLVDGELPTKIDNTYKLEPIHDKAKKLIVVRAAFTVAGTYGKFPNEPEDLPLNITAVYQLIYSSEKQVRFSAEECQDFCRQWSILHIWPYWREFVQSTTNRMGMPSLCIPLLKDTPIAESPKKKKAKTKKKEKKKG